MASLHVVIDFLPVGQIRVAPSAWWGGKGESWELGLWEEGSEAERVSEL